jgi:hypothetical protein
MNAAADAAITAASPSAAPSVQMKIPRLTPQRRRARGRAPVQKRVLRHERHVDAGCNDDDCGDGEEREQMHASDHRRRYSLHC